MHKTSCLTHDGGCCNHHDAVPSVHQTLDEMEFERGIWFAALNGNIDRVMNLMEKGLDPGAKDNAGYTALHYAARSGHKDVCSLLLQRGVDANVQTHGGATPLHRAAIQGHLDVVQLLLKYQADPLIRDSDGKTALHKAAEGGSRDVIEELLRCNENLRNILDKQGRSPAECLPPDKLELVQVLR